MLCQLLNTYLIYLWLIWFKCKQRAQIVVHTQIWWFHKRNSIFKTTPFEVVKKLCCCWTDSIRNWLECKRFPFLNIAAAKIFYRWRFALILHKHLEEIFIIIEMCTLKRDEIMTHLTGKIMSTDLELKLFLVHWYHSSHSKLICFVPFNIDFEIHSFCKCK